MMPPLPEKIPLKMPPKIPQQSHRLNRRSRRRLRRVRCMQLPPGTTYERSMCSAPGRNWCRGGRRRGCRLLDHGRDRRLVVAVVARQSAGYPNKGDHGCYAAYSQCCDTECSLPVLGLHQFLLVHCLVGFLTFTLLGSHRSRRLSVVGASEPARTQHSSNSSYRPIFQ